MSVGMSQLLGRWGVRLGDPIAVVSHDSVEGLAVLLGAMRVGAVTVLLNPELRPDALLEHLRLRPSGAGLRAAGGVGRGRPCRGRGRQQGGAADASGGSARRGHGTGSAASGCAGGVPVQFRHDGASEGNSARPSRPAEHQSELCPADRRDRGGRGLLGFEDVFRLWSERGSFRAVRRRHQRSRPATCGSRGLAAADG